MNILLISQCKKQALKETRRIIDQFAERCGDRTWQTAITQAGLTTLHKLLRKTARKNSAIACYWVRAKNHTELLWIVGDRSQFNDQGRVPTNRTKRNILRSDNENSWLYGTSIQIVATIAALLHDLGKATLGFQNKLWHGTLGDPYRHEWISLHLFYLMIDGCKTNHEVLQRLANFNDYQTVNPDWHHKLISANYSQINLKNSPSLAQWISWLIVSHHRVPLCHEDNRWDKHKQCYKTTNDAIKNQKKDSDYIEDFTTDYFFKQLAAIASWVWNPLSKHPNKEQFWQLKQSVTLSQSWLTYLNRWANKALNHPNLMQLVEQNTFIDNPFLLHLSRLALMVGDHNFSSEDSDKAIKDQNMLIANTNKGRVGKQYLDQHLLGVAKYTASFAHLLPKITNELPSLLQVKKLNQRTTIARFMWQNHAADLTKTVQEQAQQSGFFAVNMASTGCGKTLANARIMAAVSDKKRGVRFTIALGLRVLTLQTGKALRDKLSLTDEQLAILVGGSAIQQLFALTNDDDDSNEYNSTEELIEGIVDVSDSPIDEDILGTIIQNEKAKSLLFTPIVSCTIDHLILASENKRGGKHIAPILRLLSSDLVLDEPDDFDHNDLPALARLVYLAGLFGSKVLLSSATLTPHLISGLFDAYQAGRKIWQQQQQLPERPIICGWFDEFNQQIDPIIDQTNFTLTHQQFVTKRVATLMNVVVRRQGHIMQLLDYLKDKKENQKLNYKILATQLYQQAFELHQDHHYIDSTSNKAVSVGLIRFAHTDDVIATTNAWYQLSEAIPDVECHIVVYHAKQLLFLRSKLEEKLDRILNRADPNSLFTQPEIRQPLNNSDKRHHLFIVISTPVTEVGRDHDYDWAIIEPSSMRSIVQLVGRVWRHRPDKIAEQPNIAILPSNLTALQCGNSLGIGKETEACFNRPGFESKDFALASHKSADLITLEQLNNINAIARIKAPEQFNTTSLTLAELEHRVMADLFNIPISANIKRRKGNCVTSYWLTNVAHHHCCHLSLLTPFRQQTGKQTEYVCQYDEYSEYGFHFSCADNAWQTPYQLCEESENTKIHYQSWHKIIEHSHSAKPWLPSDFYGELTELGQVFDEPNLYKLALKYATVTLDDKNEWFYHPWFGFYRHSINQ